MVAQPGKNMKIPNLTIEQLLEAGVHLGHKTLRWNPKMKKYIFGKRDSIHIIDLTQTLQLTKIALEKVYETVSNNGKILFVSTKKQASEAIAEVAKETDQYFVNYRWLGGMLTNWGTISNSIKKLKDLDQKSIIGTSSYRREFQIKKIRQDLNCKLIRGNVGTRIRKLNEGMYDAIIKSYAGIKFLKFENEISEIFSAEEIIPSAGQGVIALQCRENDDETISILNKINHEETYKRAHLERNILKVLDGDCETAIGAHSVVDGDKIIVLSLIHI